MVRIAHLRVGSDRLDDVHDDWSPDVNPVGAHLTDGAVRRLRLGLHLVVAVLAIGAFLRGELADAGPALPLVAAGLVGSGICELLRRQRGPLHRLNIAELVADIAGAFGVVLIADGGTTPLGWVVLVVPVVVASVRFRMTGAVAVWVIVVSLYIAISLSSGTAGDAGTSVWLAAQQLAVLGLLAAPATYLLTHLRGEVEARGAARVRAQRAAEGLAAVTNAVRRQTASTQTPEIAAVAVETACELGAAAAQVWIQRPEGWVLGHQRGPIEQQLGDSMRASLDQSLGGRPVRAPGVNGRETLVLPIVTDPGSAAVLVCALSNRADRQILGLLTVLSQQSAVAWNNANLTVALSQRAQALSYEATHDALTGLSNRQAVMTMVQRVREVALEQRREFSLLFMDLNGFKQVNDTHGHDVGDELLIVVARRLRATLRTGDEVGRLGGDEFLLVAPDCDVEQARVLAQRIQANLGEPISVSGLVLNVGVSVGIAMADGTEGVDEVVRRADVAMYCAKRERIGAVVWSQGLEADAASGLPVR